MSKKIVFTGATRNFFKIGYQAITYLSDNYPDVEVCLAIPNVSEARGVCEGMDVELVEWDPGDYGTLEGVYDGATSTLLVPPIMDRVAVGGAKAEKASQAGVEFIVCLGVQHKNGQTALSRDVAELTSVLEQGKSDYCVLRLPMFLENLLYQMRSISEDGVFGFPCGGNRRFSYVSCSDLGPMVAEMLVNGSRVDDRLLSAAEQTTCFEIAEAFSRVLDRPIKFERIGDEEFMHSLLKDTGSAASIKAASGILELWKQIHGGKEEPADPYLGELLQRPPETAVDWIKDHACCFQRNPNCEHPHPPLVK